MELIKRYVQAVTDCLPESQRAEVARELEASIEDMARDKSDGKKPTEKQIREVLEEMGDPLIVARQYKETGDYLIGPALYHQYIRLLKYVLAMSIPIYTLIFALTQDYARPIDIVHAILVYGGGVSNVVLHVLFWITGLFIVIERKGIKVDQITDTQEEWSVDLLPELSSKPQIGRTDTIASLAFYVFLVGAGATLWQSLGQAGPVATFINPELNHFWVPALIAFGVIGLVVETIKFIRGNWSAWLVAATLAVNALGAIYIATLASGQAILNPALPEQARRIGMWSIGITVVIFIFSYVYESYKIVKDAQARRTQR